MRIAEYKQISSEEITSTILVDDLNDDGEVIGQHEETIVKTVPVMGMVYRDATPEEEAEAARQQAEFEEYEANREPTIDERMTRSEERTDVLEATTDDVILMMAELIGG